jgi:endonuclease/exonuclease/phosphatase family metal-dependent hydrolase
LSDATVRVLTWNIHGSFGRNPRFDLTRVVELIDRWDPQIVALQEVDSRRDREAGINPFEFLQRELGEHGIGAKSITTDDGDYGQMLISRWPMTDTVVHDLSYPEREPRRAIASRIETPHGPLRIVATHLGLSVHERRAQTEKLLAIAGQESIFRRSGHRFAAENATNAKNGEHCPLPKERTMLEPVTIMMGDFNDWFWVGSVRKALSRELPGRTHFRTFPSICPLLRLDRIYCRPRGAFVDCYTDRSARAVSDHLPVIADVSLNGVASRR